jgi:transposase
MGTLRVTRCHPVIQTCYERLLAAGTAKQVALEACMHTLLIILNALRTQHTPWQAQAA